MGLEKEVKNEIKLLYFGNKKGKKKRYLVVFGERCAQKKGELLDFNTS